MSQSEEGKMSPSIKLAGGRVGLSSWSRESEASQRLACDRSCGLQAYILNEKSPPPICGKLRNRMGSYDGIHMEEDGEFVVFDTC